MNNVLNWLKIRIKALELTWSDFFLALGFLTFVPFAALSWLFMVTWNPTEIAFKPWMMITCFTISVISWAIYFYIEIKKGTIKNNFFTWAFIFYAIMSVVSVLVQPKVFEIDVICRSKNYITYEYYGSLKIGQIVHVSIALTWIHRMFFCFASLLITTLVYIALMVLPKRFKTTDFLIFMGLCIFTFLLILAIYGYIVEHHKYGSFIKALLAGDTQSVQIQYGVKSFVAHRVPYGACMMLGFMYALVLHGLTKKDYWLIPAVFCYGNMIFSYCKTSLALSALSAFAYFIFCMVTTFKQHKKRNIITLTCVLTPIFIVLLLVLISIISKGQYLPWFYKIFKSFTNEKTIVSRSYIWKNIQTELKGGWWIIGRGFGTHNYFLFPMNLVNGDDVCPSHSSYYAVLGAGGIINLIGFLGLYVYFGYIFIQCFKFDKIKTIGLSLGFFAFILYSFTEGVNYLIVFFTIPLIWYYHLIKNGYVTKETEAQ